MKKIKKLKMFGLHPIGKPDLVDWILPDRKEVIEKINEIIKTLNKED